MEDSTSGKSYLACAPHRNERYHLYNSTWVPFCRRSLTKGYCSYEVVSVTLWPSFRRHDVGNWPSHCDTNGRFGSLLQSDKITRALIERRSCIARWRSAIFRLVVCGKKRIKLAPVLIGWADSLGAWPGSDDESLETLIISHPWSSCLAACWAESKTISPFHIALSAFQILQMYLSTMVPENLQTFPTLHLSWTVHWIGLLSNRIGSNFR
jgi:hypothetical protein